MIRRSTWITLGVFAVLVVFAIWWTRFRPASEAPPGATPTMEPLWEIDTSRVIGLTIERLSTGEVVSLRRQEDGAWQVVEPADHSVTNDRLERALSWLAMPQPRAVVSEASELADFGLAEPLSRVTVTLEDGSIFVMDVGAETPTGTTTFVRVPGRDGVIVMSKYGLSEVLGLVDEVLATPTPSSTAVVTETPTASPTVETPQPPMATVTRPP